MKFNRMKALSFLLLTILPLIVLRQWFLPGLPQTHDAEAHISRSAVFAKSLKEGNILPRWGGSLNWTYGTPVIMFLYPGLPYVSALINLITNWTFIDIYKLLMVVTYVLSGWFWFGWIRSLKFSFSVALVSSLFYLLAPYRLVNIFVRGALAEHIGFLWFPLLMWISTRYFQSQDRGKLILLAVFTAGLILSHNLSAVLYLPVVLIYPLVLRIKPALLIKYYLAVSGGFFLCAFFWLPVLLESKYTLSNWMFDAQKGYRTNFIAFRQLIWSPWGYGWSEPGIKDDGMSFQVGIAQWLVLTAGVGLVWFLKKSRNLLKFGLGLVTVGIFISLPISMKIWEAIPLLQKFQFPWRFLSLIVVGSALASAVVADKFKYSKIILFVLLISPILFTFSYWKISGLSNLTERFLTVDYVGTSDTGETSPIWAVRFQERFPKSAVEVVSSEGRVEINNVDKLMQKHEFEVSASGNSRIVDNTLYFPGWTVYVDGEKTPIGYQDENWRGLITFPVSAGNHKVKVIFEETRVRKLANMFSLVSLAILLAATVGGRFGIRNGFVKL